MSFKEIFLKNKTRIIWSSFILLAFIIGYSLNSAPKTSDEHNHAEDSLQKNTIWTCSMHPQVQQPNPGQCPICGMDLIPVSNDSGGDEGYREIRLSEKAIKLAEIQLARVERQTVRANIRLTGKIGYDETRLGYITSRIPGRIDRLYADYTGTTVRKGEKLADIYSPELLSTQQELIQSLKVYDQSQNGSQAISKTALQTLNAVRERLRLWGFTNEHISAIEKSGTPAEHLPIYSPLTGTVIHKNAVEGIYVNTGSPIYTIADLSQVWVLLDAYESDLSWLAVGNDAEFTAEAWPGETFKGKISFIDPVLNDKSRTIKIRVQAKNSNGRLKPDMFVHAVIKSKPVMAASAFPVSPLIIPASAPLITGKRAVVYVANPDKDGMYEGREIVLGPRTGDYYIVKEGLDEGEMVVVNGAFKIDSAIQIVAKPSMMNPEGGTRQTGHDHGGNSQKTTAPMKNNEDKQAAEEIQRFDGISALFLTQLDGVYSNYFDIQFGLSHDNQESAQKAANDLLKSLSDVDMKLLKGESHMAWMNNLKFIKKGGEGISKSGTIESARASFETLSNALIQTARQFGTSGKQAALVYHCPMAFDYKGADWIQNKEGTENPYFGSEMFKCGSKIEDLTKNK
ncbi:MAG: efflux RND transporter periplasmic adaptor subunit [Calditrichaceae bacterium]